MVRPRFCKRFDPAFWLRDHQMNLEWQMGVLAQRLHKVGKEQQVLHIMAVGDIEMKTVRVRLHTAHFYREIREVSRPEGSGAFEHRPMFVKPLNCSSVEAVAKLWLKRFNASTLQRFNGKRAFQEFFQRALHIYRVPLEAHR